MDAARAAAIPVVVVQSTASQNMPIFARGSQGWELHEVVLNRGWDHLVEKSLPSSFAGTDLGEWLAGREIEPAVEFLSDASGSVPYENRAGRASAEEIHRAFSVVQQSRFAAVMTTGEWIRAVETGEAPERDTILGSNRRARERARA